MIEEIKAWLFKPEKEMGLKEALNTKLATLFTIWCASMVALMTFYMWAMQTIAMKGA